ncbi:MAG TPA: protein-methionine-sulfoxide reductase heme-binding subunit MsrQ [Steroidobacteraceae bacterium]|jgi:sulfoxide reductase heme-binding subunit YedZ
MAMNADTATRRIAKPLVFLLCLLPLGWLAAGILQWPPADLGANPVEKVQDTLGIWGLRFLLLTLAVTPLREWFRWPRLLAFRRMLGLFAFAYIALHFLWYLFVDQAFDWRQLLADIAKRPYITLGFTALALLAPLAWTSTDRAMRRLGRRWQRLHRLVYPAAVLGCVHFWWQVKADIREPLFYAAVAALLLGWRLQRHWRRRIASSRSAAIAPGTRCERDAGQDQDSAGAGAPARLLAEQPPAQ